MTRAPSLALGRRRPGLPSGMAVQRRSASAASCLSLSGNAMFRISRVAHFGVAWFLLVAGPGSLRAQDVPLWIEAEDVQAGAGDNEVAGSDEPVADWDVESVIAELHERFDEIWPSQLERHRASVRGALLEVVKSVSLSDGQRRQLEIASEGLVFRVALRTRRTYLDYGRHAIESAKRDGAERSETLHAVRRFVEWAKSETEWSDEDGAFWNRALERILTPDQLEELRKRRRERAVAIAEHIVRGVALDLDSWFLLTREELARIQEALKPQIESIAGDIADDFESEGGYGIGSNMEAYQDFYRPQILESEQLQRVLTADQRTRVQSILGDEFRVVQVFDEGFDLWSDVVEGLTEFFESAGDDDRDPFAESGTEPVLPSADE